MAQQTLAALMNSIQPRHLTLSWFTKCLQMYSDVIRNLVKLVAIFYSYLYKWRNWSWEMLTWCIPDYTAGERQHLNRVGMWTEPGTCRPAINICGMNDSKRLQISCAFKTHLSWLICAKEISRPNLVLLFYQIASDILPFLQKGQEYPLD